jgi:hypothetical protein
MVPVAVWSGAGKIIALSFPEVVGAADTWFWYTGDEQNI